MRYQEDCGQVNGRVVHGQFIAHAVPRLGAVKRAFLGADLHRGDQQLVHPTVTQLAIMLHVSASYIHHALRVRDADRTLIERGFVPLVSHAPRLTLPAPTPTEIDLVSLASTVGPDRWLEAAAAAGI